jgi:hypothetical protein
MENGNASRRDGTFAERMRASDQLARPNVKCLDATPSSVLNLHFNNWSCTSAAAPLPAWAYQTLWVNKRIGVLDSTAPVPAPMSPLNAPDSPTRPDCQLGR